MKDAKQQTMEQKWQGDMKIIVGVKRVVDYNVKVRVKSDGSGIELTNVKMSMNPFDEIALEEAIRLREKGVATEVVAISIGSAISQETLRTALAMGADRAILVVDKRVLEPLEVAIVFRELVKVEAPNLVIFGKQAIDDDSNQTGQMLAGLLGWGQAAFASAMNVKNGEAIVEREVDAGVQTIAVRLPAVITADLRLNEPRYASLPNIMQARRKIIEEKTLSELGITYKPHIKVLKIEEPEARQPGIRVNSVAELVKRLRQEKNLL
ncbi:MAG: electron transfer flavoprotein beta subunit [Candidatus Tokpelaia sp. JSC188]|nr:MAG: electron transfer flavoprotein beta subunit [Candidatus Tokpelaia sp. JSC188]